LYYGLKDYESASTCFQLATYIDEEFIGAYMERGKALERLKNYAEAIESYNRTIELDDPTSYALLRIGKCYEKLGNKVEALKYFNKTVHEDPLLDKGWIAITDFYVRQKNYQKALYYVNKALAIDDQNRLYWKRYATINKAIDHFEEAEFGYRKAIEFGDYQLDTWLFWVDIMLIMGEYNNAILTLIQASEYFPDDFEIEYRLAGFHMLLNEEEKGNYHLSNGLRINMKHQTLLKEMFPTVWDRISVQDYIAKHAKP
jgi:tetratricopeptide (TPR) repeat protein